MTTVSTPVWAPWISFYDPTGQGPNLIAQPAGDGLMLVASRLGVPASDLAYVGDAPNDLRAARAVGGVAAAAAWGHQYDPGEPADVTLAAPIAALDLLS